MRKASFTLVSLVLALGVYGGDGTIIRKPTPVANRYAVVLQQPLDGSVEDLLAEVLTSVPASVRHVWKYALSGFELEMSEKDALRVSRLPFVAQVEEVTPRHEAGTQIESMRRCHQPVRGWTAFTATARPVSPRSRM